MAQTSITPKGKVLDEVTKIAMKVFINLTDNSGPSIP
jgi:hypothetical protein